MHIRGLTPNATGTLEYELSAETPFQRTFLNVRTEGTLKVQTDAKGMFGALSLNGKLNLKNGEKEILLLCAVQFQPSACMFVFEKPSGEDKSRQIGDSVPADTLYRPRRREFDKKRIEVVNPISEHTVRSAVTLLPSPNNRHSGAEN